mgnify:CR=1 FL=1
MSRRQKKPAYAGRYQLSTGNYQLSGARTGLCLCMRRETSQLLNLPARRLEDQLDDLLGDVGLQAFGVPLLQSHDVSDDVAVLAVREFEDLRFAARRQQAP